MSVPLSTNQFELKNKPIRDMPRRKVSVSKFLPTQVDSDPEKIASMEKKDPSSFEKVPVVLKKDGMYLVGDGHHRIAAAMNRGDSTVDVRIVKS